MAIVSPAPFVFRSLAPVLSNDKVFSLRCGYCSGFFLFLLIYHRWPRELKQWLYLHLIGKQEAPTRCLVVVFLLTNRGPWVVVVFAGIIRSPAVCLPINDDLQ